MADRSVVYRLRAEVSQFRAQMAAAGASVKDSADKMTGATKESQRYRAGLKELGDTAGKVGLVAGAGLAVAVHAAANFDQAMSKVQAATHESAANMDLLRVAAIKAGQDTKYSASEAAEGIESLAKAGVTTADILNGGLDGALSLAAAGNQSVADSAETAASAMTQFKLAGKDIPHIADLLAAGAGKAQGEVSDLAMALNQTGLVAAQTGLSIDETTAGLSAFASAGLIGSDAGTSFKTMLLRLTPQSSKAQKAMDALGLSAYNQQGQFIGLANYAGVLHDRLKDMSAEQRQATLQTIFGQDAIRAANVLYDQGAKGISAWTQKVNDQGYAAETAAIKMDNLAGDLEQLRGSLETALIGTGEGAQGPLRTLTQSLTSVVNAYSSLPPSAHNATTAVLAVTAAVGGGLFIFTRAVSGLAAVRLALTQVGVSAERSATLMRGVKRAGLAFAGLEVAVIGLGKLQDAMAKTIPGANALQGALLDLESTGESTQLGAFDDLGSAIDRLANKSGLDKTADTINSIVTLGQLDATKLRDAKTEINGLDEALAGLVSTGHADEAAKALKTLATQQGLTSDQTRDLASHLPQYNDALAGVGTSAKLAAADQASATKTIVKGFVVSSAQLDKALEASRKAANETAHSFVGLGKNVDNSKVSLEGWIKQLRRQAAALKDFRENAAAAGKKGLDEGLTAALEKAGPAGALRMRQLAHATKDQIAEANKAWREGERQVNLYTDAIGGVPKAHATKIFIDGIDPALAKLEALAGRLRDLHNRTITVTTVRRTGGRSVDGYATGGYTGPGGAHEVAGVVHRGEVVLPQGIVKRDWNMLRGRYGYLPGFASGGLVGGRSAAPPVASAGIDYDRLARALAAVRPVYGDVHLQPHDYSEFQREMAQDQARASLSGVRS